jgi:hypothetical protein
VAAFLERFCVHIKHILLLVGVALSGACSDSYSPTPSASGVFPAEGFIGRKVRVEISGEETKWADGATVSFGDGITVSNVAVASESAIFADLDIANTASLSDHDVTVTSGKETDTLKAAFKTKSPIEITIQGQAAQGSIGQFKITNHDVDNLFDTTHTGDGLFVPIVYTNVALDAGPGVTLQLSALTQFDITGIILIDVDAPAMTAPITVVSGPAGGTQVTSSLGAPTAIMARTPTAITSDTTTFAVANPFDSMLYSLTSDSPELAQLSIASSNPNGQPGLAILAASGHFADILGGGATTNQIPKPQLYVIAYDLTGATGSVQITNHTVALTSMAADTEPGNNTSTGATQVTAPALVDNATLSSESDEDWYKLTVPVGKSIHVVTTPGDPGTDTLVDIYAAGDLTTPLAESSDLDYHEDVVSDPTTAAGTYYVKISASHAGFFSTAQTGYLAAIFLE